MLLILLIIKHFCTMRINHLKAFILFANEFGYANTSFNDVVAAVRTKATEAGVTMSEYLEDYIKDK